MRTRQDVREGAALWVSFAARRALRAGQVTEFAEVAHGDGHVSGSTATSILHTAGVLPFKGAVVASNTFPTGFEVHHYLTVPTLVGWGGDHLDLLLSTNAAYTGSFGGFRTGAVVAPNATIDVSFDCEIVNLSATTETADLVIELTHIGADGDGTTTGPQRDMFRLQGNPKRIRTRITAPSVGTAYRLAIWVNTSDTTAGQQIRLKVKNLMVNATNTGTCWPGSRWLLPPYAAAVATDNTTLTPGVSAGDYYMLMRTVEFGWFIDTVTIASTADSLSLLARIGGDGDARFAEVLLIAVSAWMDGDFDLIDPPDWKPIKYVNGATHATSRPQSPATLGRLTGAVEGQGWLQAHPQPYALNWLPTRLRDTRSETHPGDFSIEDVNNGNHSNRAEAKDRTEWAYGVDFWYSAWVTFDAPITSQFAIITQMGAARPAGHTSSLSPEFDLRILPGNLLQMKVRSDNGTMVTTGDGDAAGLTVTTFGPWAFSPGAAHHILVRLNFSQTGGGSSDMWLDGVRKVTSTAPLGYARPTGPGIKWGLYNYANSDTVKVAHRALEFGNRDLSARATKPIPFR